MDFLFAFQNHATGYDTIKHGFSRISLLHSRLPFAEHCGALAFEHVGTGVKVVFLGTVPHIPPTLPPKQQGHSSFDPCPESPSVVQQHPRALWRGPPWRGATLGLVGGNYGPNLMCPVGFPWNPSWDFIAHHYVPLLCNTVPMGPKNPSFHDYLQC